MDSTTNNRLKSKADLTGSLATRAARESGRLARNASQRGRKSWADRENDRYEAAQAADGYYACATDRHLAKSGAF